MAQSDELPHANSNISVINAVVTSDCFYLIAFFSSTLCLAGDGIKQDEVWSSRGFECWYARLQHCSLHTRAQATGRGEDVAFKVMSVVWTDLFWDASKAQVPDSVHDVAWQCFLAIVGSNYIFRWVQYLQIRRQIWPPFIRANVQCHVCYYSGAMAFSGGNM